MASSTSRLKGRQRFALPPRVVRILNITGLIVALLLLLVAVLWRIPSDYLLHLPVSAESVEPKIYVAGHPSQSGRGQFLMTTVLESRASILERIVMPLDQDATLEDLPKDYSQSQSEQ